ncbi:NADH:ubiquinone oxidoreductase subunit C [Candidatus Marinamargulisbacteria bacterium SCGC AG-333-B06]|nr:NADH:ubiquinone oxidoreductase subunit C [Candidatus Marinamargulisbacteria bacterium SCGC AG-333-B06]
MLSEAQKTFRFAIIMCVCCSLALTAASVGLKERQDENKLIDRQKNILKALNLISKRKKYSGEEIKQTYSDNVKEYYLDDKGELTKAETNHAVFLVGDKTNIKTYAVPFKAYGLWSWIYGYIALAGDGDSIVGFTVYSHGETPGLGGECEKDWFQDQFIGKSITDINGNFVSIGVVKGKVADKGFSQEKSKNYVDGMSGATITSKGIEDYLRKDLAAYEAFAKQLRRKG